LSSRCHPLSTFCHALLPEYVHSYMLPNIGSSTFILV
jgi:hypothetical protein